MNFPYILKKNGVQTSVCDALMQTEVRTLHFRVLRGFVGKTAYRFFFWLIADLRGKHDELQEYRGGKVLQQVGFQMIYNTFLL